MNAERRRDPSLKQLAALFALSLCALVGCGRDQGALEKVALRSHALSKALGGVRDVRCSRPDAAYSVCAVTTSSGTKLNCGLRRRGAGGLAFTCLGRAPGTE